MINLIKMINLTIKLLNNKNVKINTNTKFHNNIKENRLW